MDKAMLDETSDARSRAFDYFSRVFSIKLLYSKGTACEETFHAQDDCWHLLSLKSHFLPTVTLSCVCTIAQPSDVFSLYYISRISKLIVLLLNTTIFIEHRWFNQPSSHFIILSTKSMINLTFRSFSLLIKPREHLSRAIVL